MSKTTKPKYWNVSRGEFSHFIIFGRMKNLFLFRELLKRMPYFLFSNQVLAKFQWINIAKFLSFLFYSDEKIGPAKIRFAASSIETSLHTKNQRQVSFTSSIFVFVYFCYFVISNSNMLDILNYHQGEHKISHLFDLRISNNLSNISLVSFVS